LLRVKDGFEASGPSYWKVLKVKLPFTEKTEEQGCRKRWALAWRTLLDSQVMSSWPQAGYAFVKFRGEI
jgi:hypothetical protein